MNGSNLITKLQAKHDLLKQTLGEGELSVGGGHWRVLPTGSRCGPLSCYRWRSQALGRMRSGTGATYWNKPAGESLVQMLRGGLVWLQKLWGKHKSEFKLWGRVPEKAIMGPQ